MMIRYRVIPPGVGPDDYEPADLEARVELFAFPDSTPWVGLLKSTVEAPLPPGARAAILRVREQPGGQQTRRAASSIRAW
ncbi:hypothetical protein [Streptomyces sp. NPDC005181]|uniref:hypothetical protein n=1 Tax=Streptomyces sp. NPDC005181 TaxID=3156869 RepID=UPI0033AF0342